eukprot:CAMPEP_0201927126 /NCGR_PEP_ID=MMETSP0903-20130614/17922_1 /ASSEMBLY_ACC=CAM_ASM_000552 /TAXON_ID=420261 /ORGANISM="Thalassiosira antarctica, Strain CCMP982" /LENGTH=44 /DNA_ID= /DNA_START= /DNA_END= /DNA_ORIENTATION=
MALVAMTAADAQGALRAVDDSRQVETDSRRDLDGWASDGWEAPP